MKEFLDSVRDMYNCSYVQEFVYLEKNDRCVYCYFGFMTQIFLTQIPLENRREEVTSRRYVSWVCLVDDSYGWPQVQTAIAILRKRFIDSLSPLLSIDSRDIIIWSHIMIISESSV